jgi:arylamine N-acetyltransferase
MIVKQNTKALYDKIVRRRRGGFCYELNGLFAWLLRQLGFTVTLLSARVAQADGDFSPEFDHLKAGRQRPWSRPILPKMRLLLYSNSQATNFVDRHGRV